MRTEKHRSGEPGVRTFGVPGPGATDKSFYSVFELAVLGEGIPASLPTSAPNRSPVALRAHEDHRTSRLEGFDERLQPFSLDTVLVQVVGDFVGASDNNAAHPPKPRQDVGYESRAGDIQELDLIEDEQPVSQNEALGNDVGNARVLGRLRERKRHIGHASPANGKGAGLEELAPLFPDNFVPGS